MSRRGSGTGRKRGAGKKSKPEWQPTINQFFGGKSVPVQPTLNHFFKTSGTISNSVLQTATTAPYRSGGDGEGEGVRSEREGGRAKPLSPQCQRGEEGGEEGKEDRRCSGDQMTNADGKPDENTLGRLASPCLQSLNPFSVPRRQGPEARRMRLQRKPLSLKSRAHSDAHSTPIPQHTPLLQGLSLEEQELLLGYASASPATSHQPSLVDLEETRVKEEEEADKGTKRSVAVAMFSPAKAGVKRHHPTTPSFSPHTHPSHSTTLPLFSTPSPPTHGEEGRMPSHGTGEFKRVLFPAMPTDPEPAAVSGSQPSLEDFSFSEFNITHDLLETSCDWSHDQAAELTQYLVLETERLQSNEGGCPELKLRLLDVQSSTEKICFLRDEWMDCELNSGDVVQLNLCSSSSSSSSSSSVISKASDSSLVLEPNCLISGTTVATSISCARRAVLSERVKGCGGDSEAMVMGRLSHEVFQDVLQQWKETGASVTMATVMVAIEKVVHKMSSLELLYSVGLSDSYAQEKLARSGPATLDWCRRFLHVSPQSGQGTIEYKRSSGTSDDSCCVSVCDILDIEENFWSPRYGLKGKVDVTVRVRERRRCEGEEEEEEECVAPLELKTGKMFRKQGSIDHRAQLTLYSLMLEERTMPPTHCRGGLLFYLKAGHMQGLPLLAHEKRGLLVARNRLARYLGNRGLHSMPRMLQDPHTCQRCPYLPQCSLYHRAMENGTEETSGLGPLFTEHTHTLTPSQLHFFSSWYRLIMEEHGYCSAGVRGGVGSVWRVPAEQREKEGVCLSAMIALPAALLPSGQWQQVFRKQVQPVSELQSPLSANEKVIVSRQDGSGWAIAMATISSVASLMEVEVLIDKPVSPDGTVYRLDSVSTSSSSVPLTNLVKLCSSDCERDHRLRDLIIDLYPPRFSPSAELGPTHSRLCDSLNAGQLSVVKKVLQARDYVLVLGLPGTGKTTTIAALVRVLVARQQSVLLTSYTHSAVDNILLKLKEVGVDFLRLGSAQRVHPSILPHTPSHSHTNVSTVQQLEDLYHSKLVVATTSLGVNHVLFSRQSFDYCIVDEASQITLPVCLGPLRHSRVFVLVGDHYQLPPLVQSETAREGGLDVSLFRRLTEHHSGALVSLSHQYRMNRDIMDLANNLTYNGRLCCGSEEVATGRLSLPQLLSFTCQHWVKACVDPDNSLVFLDTDQCADGQEVCKMDGVSNPLEARVISRIALTLVKAGLPSEAIGVVTPYRHQQHLIQEYLTTPPATPTSGIEVNTVDKYQGRDKPCVLLSLVRSNHHKKVGSLLLDWRRVNVAVTRARHKLILVGSSTTLCHAPLLHSLLQFVRERGCMVTMTTTD